MTPVLVFCPVHPQKGLHPLTRQALDSLTYPLKDVWLSYGDNPYYGFNVLTDGNSNVLHNYQKARQIFLSGSWDYLMTIESDMVPPPDVIERLLYIKADVAYSLYCFRGKLRRWSAYTELHPGWGTSLSAVPYEALDLFGQVVEVAGIGLGATLIKRRVLEKLDFHGIHGFACDGWFAIDCQKEGFAQMCDTGLISGHIDGDVVIYPSIDSDTLYRETPVYADYADKRPMG